MTKFLQVVLDGRDPMFSLTLRQLERAAGSRGDDIAYTASIRERAHQTMRSLGLDPADTTALELFNVLSSYADNDDVLRNHEDVALLVGNDVISFNPHDVRASRGKQFHERSTEHVRRSVHDGLVARYGTHVGEDRVRSLMKDAGVKTTKSADAPAAAPAPKQDADAPLVLCVGDIITDAFIKLSEDYAQEYVDDKGYKRISFELGAKLPYDEVEIVQAVECSPNAAVSLTRLGLRTSLMSWIGDDGPGNEMVEYLKTQGVGTDDIVVETGMKSNYHYVLRYGADRTKLQRFEDYSYKWRPPHQKPNWLYLGVLGEKTWPLHEAMLKYLHENPDIKLVFQPGMYHLMWGTEKMAPFYDRAEIVIMNREEAAQVTGKERGDVKELIKALHDLGVTVAVVTDGADGAYASDGSKVLFMKNYPDPKPPLDRTGAGDAFASTIAAALALGQSLETALEWAPINSMSVVQQMGAQAGLLKLPKLKKYLKDAPKGYEPKEFK